MANSRTFGGNNNATQIAGDAADLSRVADLDFEANIPSIRDAHPDITNRQLEQIRDRLHRENRDYYRRINEQYGTNITYDGGN